MSWGRSQSRVVRSRWGLGRLAGRTGRLYAAVPRPRWCPRASSWSVWLCLPSRRSWFFNDFCADWWEFTRFMDQISCGEGGEMAAQHNWNPPKPGTVWSLNCNGAVLRSQVREKVSHSWLAHLRVTEVKLRECFLSSRAGSTRLRQTLLPGSSCSSSPSAKCSANTLRKQIPENERFAHLRHVFTALQSLDVLRKMVRKHMRTVTWLLYFHAWLDCDSLE